MWNLGNHLHMSMFQSLSSFLGHKRGRKLSFSTDRVQLLTVSSQWSDPKVESQFLHFSSVMFYYLNHRKKAAFLFLARDYSQHLFSTLVEPQCATVTLWNEVGHPQQKTPNFRCPKLYLDWSTWEELVTLRFEFFDHDLCREGWLSMNAVWFTLAQLKRHAAFNWMCWHQYSSVRWKYFLVSEWINAFNSLWYTADSTGRSHPAFTRSLLLYMCRIQCSSWSPQHYVTH